MDLSDELLQFHNSPPIWTVRKLAIAHLVGLYHRQNRGATPAPFDSGLSCCYTQWAVEFCSQRGEVSTKTVANRYCLVPRQMVYTLFHPALDKITTPAPGSLDDFIGLLQEKLDKKLGDGYPPDAPTLTDIVSE